MSNILVYENRGLTLSPAEETALGNLTMAQQIIVAAGLQPKIKHRNEVEVIDELVSILSNVYTMTGQTSDPVTLAGYAVELYTNLMHAYPLITTDEIKAAIKAGACGAYGEYFGLNIKSFFFFIRSYLYSVERIQAGKDFITTQLLLPEVTQTPEEITQDNKDFVNHLYKDFLQQTLLRDYIPSFVCKFLEDEGKIILTKEEKQAIVNRAKTYYVGLVNSEKTANSLNDTMMQPMMQSNTPDVTVKNIARQIAVYDFFESYKSAGQTIIF